jgi:hypothetical protein
MKLRLLLAAGIFLSLACLVQARTFTNTAGRTIEAEVLAVSGAQVTMKLANGSTVTFDIAKLSATDQEFVKSWKPASAPQEPAPKGSGNAKEFVEGLGGTFDESTGAAIITKKPDLTVANLEALAATGQIKKLTLDGCKLGSDGVAVLPKFKGLAGINFTHTMVNKIADLKVLSEVTTLQEIDLGGSDFGDEGLAALCQLKELKSLQLGHVGRSDKTAMTADGLKALQGLPKLEILMLHFQKLDEAMIPVLAELKTVKEFKVGGVTKDFLAKLQAAMPQAKVASRGPTID